MRPADLVPATGEVVELLQQLIRNACVNDGRPESGEEARNTDALVAHLEGSGIDMERFPSGPGRDNLVARIEGRDPAAPKICLMGHTDVVPVNPSGWDEDPFGGDLVAGEVWGRGAVDMLNLTASMAVVARALGRSGWRPPGDIVFLAVADEEAAGRFGAGFMVEHHWDAIACDYVLTENGGLVSGPANAPTVSMNVAEKGFAWRRLVVRGTPGHGSMPYGADNALLKAAEVVRRLHAYRPPTVIDELWRQRVATLDLSPATRADLLDPTRAYDAIATLGGSAAAGHFHACTHTTFAPTMAHGGVKTNVIPDLVDLDVDIRTLPGETAESVSEHLRLALGELAEHVEVSALADSTATSSPTGTPLWEAMAAASRASFPGAQLAPGMVVGFTDARFFRERDVVAYGAGLFSPSLSGADFSARFHGNNERVDVESLRLTTEFYLRTLDRLWA
ncbi:MAG: M20/M25/M40 family metallo-hydrolase [Acidimicrobiia bacterium]|nr:M20/M25/M40 family metallo-hydrolase [Acidimicrobiia bacterium]